MGKLDLIYRRLPVWGQHAAASVFGLYWHWLRFGPGYERFVTEYAARDHFTTSRWNEWQQERLCTLLSIAANHVLYYRSTWTEHEKVAACAGRLDQLPLLGKEPLRSDAWAFVRDDVPVGRPHVFHTSGSTGTPIASIWTTQELRNSLALREVRSARWAGVSFTLPRATFSGRMVEPDPASTGPFYRFNFVERQAYLSAFHLRPDTAAKYLDALERHHIQWATGYAVSFYLLAKFALDNHLKVPLLKAIVTTSEKVTPEMRVTMENAFQCRVFEEYSTVENVVFASDCEQGRLHVSPDASIVEILRPDGTPCEAGEVGEVVATCLMREFQPLVRFRLGDLAAWDPEPCPCGRQMPVLKEVIGRLEDVVVGPDGRQLVRFHGIFVNQPHVVEGQIVQKSLERITVKVVTAPGFSADDARDIVTRMRQRLGGAVQVEVEVVDRIPRTKAGKFKAVISLLPRRAVNSDLQPGHVGDSDAF